MPATLARLVDIRSQLAEEALAFLKRTAKAAAEMPAYYPEHMKSLDPGAERFDAIRQVVQVHDRKDYNAWLGAERERLRAAGLADDGVAYRYKRARTEAEDQNGERSRGNWEEAHSPPPPIEWDASTGQRYQHAVILGDPVVSPMIHLERTL